MAAISKIGRPEVGAEGGGGAGMKGQILTVGSLFSGIAGDIGLEQAGMKVLWRVEKDRYCRQVIRAHFPYIPLFEDIKDVTGQDLPRVHVLCGGFPCQDLSTANSARKGLKGERSALFWEHIRLIRELHPRWVLIENVPGLLSSNGGRDMATVLGALGDCGYGWAYRVLDSQFFGVPQRRRRVYIVGHSGGDWERPAKVLFEQEGLRGDIKKGGEEGKETAYSLTSRVGGRDQREDTYVIQALQARDYKGVGSQYVQEGKLIISVHPAQTGSNGWGVLEDGTTHTIDSSGGDRVSIPTRGVRRLTPLECERLQGFPDGWTEGLSDTQQYKALGNAWTVPVIKWLGERITQYDS